MERLESRSAAETRRRAGMILRKLLPLGRRPLILALDGDLGSGKTTFIQGLAHSLGIRGRTKSPTFVLMKWYDILPRRRRTLLYRHLIHADAYRIGTIAEARRLGFAEVFSDPNAIVVVEWADRIRKLVPQSAVWIRFRHGGHPHERILKISNL
ncbi:MAG: tRNA (adenosine(37)-N6)-threonylcarbamoyltransferase complex ATPase subunit type 1 TsaE [bacterium]|nr:tRNA (adenosine(37)-N6)-threonylcarbamoyltransferase complex ATPase subunit type 1 TsaE [bacterium]